MMETNQTVEPTYRRARAEDRAAIFRVLEFVNFHNVPSPEMPVFDLAEVFVAEVDGTIVGVAGWTLLGDGRGKTTLMAVDPAFRRYGIGARLQSMRMRVMRDAGCRTVITNADLPDTIAWYEKKFGYRQIGTLAKIHEFGDPMVDHWTTLECDLDAWDAAEAAADVRSPGAPRPA
jgi:ribosomal-protein-alanine N-acetyltransferase